MGKPCARDQQRCAHHRQTMCTGSAKDVHTMGKPWARDQQRCAHLLAMMCTGLANVCTGSRKPRTGSATPYRHCETMRTALADVYNTIGQSCASRWQTMCSLSCGHVRPMVRPCERHPGTLCTPSKDPVHAFQEPMQAFQGPCARLPRRPADHGEDLCTA